jgi:hypothetical protein
VVVCSRRGYVQTFKLYCELRGEAAKVRKEGSDLLSFSPTTKTMTPFLSSYEAQETVLYTLLHNVIDRGKE